ncbi:acyl-CoA dehydrogenase family protein, partial [Bradyrhizobium sp. INPA03-11B]|uniref:acyl-CoA dehydrogenase family protein n=1 Tax=Bradyrhizobium sp. INPA03-11B TaxID=418598 RepID=UPI00338E528B
MKVSLTDEQVEIVRSIRKLFTRECPPSLVRQLQDPDAEVKPASLWSHLAESGVFGLALPMDVGGQDATLFDLGLVYEEGGRVLCPTIVHSTIEFGLVLSRLATGNPRASEWLHKLAAGDILATVAIADPADSSNVAPSISAERRGSKWALSGSLDFVPNADVVDALLTTARVKDSWGHGYDIAVLLPREAISARRRATFARDNQCRLDL